MGVIHGGSIIESVRASGIVLQPEARVIVVDPADTGFTPQDAIDEAVAGNGDIILQKPGGFEVTESVLFNKAGIRYMATGPTRNPLVRGEFHSIFSDASFTDGPAAKITAPCVIEGIGFVSRDTGATFFSGAALLIGGDADANPFGVHLKNCRFPKWALDNRIGVAVEGSSDCFIDECIFEGVGANFDAGIYVQGATQNLEIRGNRFRSCDFGIVHGSFADTAEPHCIYAENICEDSKLFDHGGNDGSGAIIGNYLEAATDTASYGASIATMKSAGFTFAGNHYAE